MYESGISEKCFIALKEWFTPGGIKPADNGIVITQNHVFANGLNGFLECELSPGKNSYTSKNIGELMGKQYLFELKITIPEDGSITHGTINYFLNKPAIVLIADTDGEIVYQIGTEHFPAYFSKEFKMGTNKENANHFDLSLSCISKHIQFYSGEIKLWENPYVNNGYPIFYSLSPISTNSLLDLSIYYQYAFTYSISKIYNLIAARGLRFIQLVYRNDHFEYLNENPVLDTSSIIGFINSLKSELDKMIPTKDLQLYGSKLLVTDTNATEQYLGLSLLDSPVIISEDGQAITAEDGQYIIPE